MFRLALSLFISSTMAAPRAKPRAASLADARIIVLHGPEQFLVQLRTEDVKAALRQQHGAFDLVQYAGTTPAADVLDECRSLGLLTAHKLVIVNDADQFVKEANRPLVERYAAQPAPGATLLLRASRWYAGKLDELIAKVGLLAPCAEMSPAEAIAWVVENSPKRHQAPIDRAAATRLVERAGPDLGRLDAELGKLAIAADAGQPITSALVAELVGRSREEEVWAVQSALLSGDPEQAVGRVRDLIEVSRHAPIRVAWSITDLARKLHTASRALRQGAAAPDLARGLRLFGDAVRVLDVARATPPDHALALFRAAVQADSRGKSGLGDPARTLERLAVQFCRPRA